VIPADVQRFLKAPHGHFIDGAEVGPRTSLPVVNPATGETQATIGNASASEVDRAVGAARQAHEDGRWSRLAPARQAELLWRLGELLARDTEQLALLESLDVGTPITQTRASHAVGVRTLQYYAGWPTKIAGRVNPTGPELLSYSAREPVGVVAGITAWNSPLVQAASKTAPALAAGNTIVLKPAEQAPLSTLWFARLAIEAGIPPGVVNVVNGTGAEAGVSLTEHPDVSLVSFTGSVPVGQEIHRRVSDGLKGVVLELGGKSPFLVFPDADLTGAADSALGTFAKNAGQTCYSATRLIVHRSVVDRFVSLLAARVRALRMGPGADPRTQVGPVVSARQRERVQSYIDGGIEVGGTAVVGGGQAAGPGYFVNPTLFTGLPVSAQLVREEIFGPVVAVLPFDTEAEALALANDTPFGLGAGVWTSDIAVAHRVARRLRAGNVWINSYGVLDRSAAYGGVKKSGVGREHGAAWIEHFTELKTVFLPTG
jgi:acyl-CoA reductase-like NAD-dependent aldehyde dehydrogenase